MAFSASASMTVGHLTCGSISMTASRVHSALPIPGPIASAWLCAAFSRICGMCARAFGASDSGADSERLVVCCLLENLRNVCGGEGGGAVVDRVSVLAGHVLQVAEYGFREFRLQHGHYGVRARECHEAGAAPEGGPRAECGGSRHVAGACDNHRAALFALVAPVIALGQHLRYERFLCEVDLLVELFDNLFRVAKRRYGRIAEYRPAFARVCIQPREPEHQGFKRVCAGFPTPVRLGVVSGRGVGRDNRDACGADVAHRGCVQFPQFAVRSVPEHAIDNQIEIRESRCGRRRFNR